MRDELNKKTKMNEQTKKPWHLQDQMTTKIHLMDKRENEPTGLEKEKSGRKSSWGKFFNVIGINMSEKYGRWGKAF